MGYLKVLIYEWKHPKLIYELSVKKKGFSVHKDRSIWKRQGERIY